MVKVASSGATSSRPFNLLFSFIFLLFSVVGLWVMRIEPVRENVPVNFEQILNTARFDNGTPLKKTYTRIERIDDFLSFLVTAFMAGTAGWDARIRLQQVHFLVNFFSVLCIWNVEACRKRNAWRVVSFPAIFAVFYQTIGGAVVLPLFYLAYVHSSSADRYYASGRQVPLSYAKALLPAAVLGYLVPTISLYLPWANIATTQNLTAFWQPAPLFVNFLLWIFSYTVSPSPGLSKDADTKYLKKIYLTAAVVSAVTHVGVLYICITSRDPEVSLSSVFLPDKAMWKTSMALGVHWIFQVDWWGCFGSSLFWGWLAAFDMLRLVNGRAGYGELVKVALGIGVLAVLAGPGATMAVIWSWREDMMLKFEKSSVWESPKPKDA